MDQSFSSVSLLLPLSGENNGTTFTDWSIQGHTGTGQGGIHTVVAESKFYGSSTYFDGVDDNIEFSDDPSLHLGTADFTIEMYVQFSSLPSASSAFFISQRDNGGSNRAFDFGYLTNGNVNFGFTSDGSTGVNVGRAWTPALDTWYHIAVSRSGSDLSLYIDGVLLGSIYNVGIASVFDSTSPLRVGAINATASGFFHGYMQDLRITRGVGRYTENFTPPARFVKSVTGVVTDGTGAPMSRKLRTFDRDTGRLISEVYSSEVDGSYHLQSPEVLLNVVLYDDGVGLVENDQITRILPC